MSKSEYRAGRNGLYFILIFALIAGLISTGCQMRNQYADVPPNQEIGSTNELMQISRELEKPRYAGIVSAIDYHSGNYPIRSSESHKRFSDNLLKDYLGELETMSDMVRDKTVSPGRAYEEMGFEIEKAWCNNDVQKYVYDSRRVEDQSSHAINSYSAFEEFAKYCLSKDNKTCSDMDKGQIIDE
jgi:hypothetical protein